MPSDKFFSRQNIHTQIWATIAGIIGFAAANLYGSFSGPAKVVVDTEATKAQPINVNIVDGQGITKHDLENLTSAISALNATAAKQDQSGQLKAVKSDLSKLQATLEKQSRPKESPNKSAQNLNGTSVTTTPNLDTGQQAAKSAVSRPVDDNLDRALARYNREPGETAGTGEGLVEEIRSHALETRAQTERLRQSLAQTAAQEEFSPPTTAKGYTTESIQGVKNSYCPPDTLRSGVPITVGFELQNSSLLTTASPLMMSINRVEGKYSQTQIDRAQTPLRSGPNSVTSTVNLDPGTYEITYGYYLKNKLAGEFPPFYSKTCTVRVPPKNS
ncbi:hypothetical protein CD58_29155 [Pseudomonas brassicacearum]|uniref:hypothetical protein n=1 Tax=Pseudomonas brassicacearum TaxID=930166 RepID=UPI00042EFA22|nr:hypothetical protein [Pseudomonas brassicacearum]AHL36948.1 hypothetical protein CD58_29155 [Pseudomonas brassicacearum]